MPPRYSNNDTLIPPRTEPTRSFLEGTVHGSVTERSPHVRRRSDCRDIPSLPAPGSSPWPLQRRHRPRRTPPTGGLAKADERRADTEPLDTGEVEQLSGAPGQGVLPIYRRHGQLIRCVPILALVLFILWFGRTQADSRKWLDIGTEAMYLAIAAAGVNILLGYTGLRWGEATALRLCDIDLVRRRIDVRRAHADVGGHIVLGTPKSHQARTVPIPRFLACELSELTDGKKPDDLVFTTPGGHVLRLPNWRREAFLSARSQAGISARFRVHDLRHTAASLMIQAGYPPKMLQEIMGHASITTTLDLYGHLYPGDMDRYADRLDTAIEEASTAKIRPDETDEGSDGAASGR